ncbi:unnamed protein product [Discula destructiva]
MRMRGLDICRVWSRVPGLNDYWCQQIQWRISKDDELIGALTEPRYPCPDDSLDTIILTQTVYLCQLLLHLQEFDPCATDTTDSHVPNDELLTVFQDSLAREFNFAYSSSGPDRQQQQQQQQQGPAPVGEALERLVRGLMLAQRQEPTPTPPPRPTSSAAVAAVPPPASPTEANRAQLHSLLVRILRELNEPVDRNPIRYAQAYGPRRDDTWAARFATRVMQWRWTVRYAPGALVDEVIEVQRHDVHPLDAEGLEVYRILRCTAPGLIHIVTPLHPETMGQQQHHHQQQQQQHAIAESPHAPPSATDDPLLAHQHRHRHRHQRSASSGMKVQRMLGTPLAQTPVSSHSEGSDTPRTTPQFPQPTAADSNSSSSIKRGSEDLGGSSSSSSNIPPAKRSRPTTMVVAAVEEKTTAAAAAAAAAADDDEKRSSSGDAAMAARAAMAMAMTDELAIRSGPMDIDAQSQPRAAVSMTAEETNALLRRTLEGIAELGRKMDGMQAAMDQRLKGLDDKLNRIFEWVGSED